MRLPDWPHSVNEIASSPTFGTESALRGLVHGPAPVTPSAKTVLVGDEREWPSDLGDCLARDGYAVDRVAELSMVPSLLTEGQTRALFVIARPLAASDLLLLRRVRETSPLTSIVVVTRTPTHPDLKRAFESGATAFLSWPSSTEALRQAIESGGHESGQLTLSNRMPPNHPQRLELENAIRSALSGLAGRWDVALEEPRGNSLVVAVVAPDGSAWSMSCCNPEHWDPASIAETVRAACHRRRWLDPAGADRLGSTQGRG